MAQYAAEDALQAAAPAIANPAPLGLSAFALTTFVLSASNAGFTFPSGSAGGTVVIGLALFYGGLVQLVAGIQEFRTGNTFGATAFCSYGGFWLALGFILLPGSGILASLVATKTLSQGVGVFLLGWTIFTGLMLIATFRISGALDCCLCTSFPDLPRVDYWLVRRSRNRYIYHMRRDRWLARYYNRARCLVHRFGGCTGFSQIGYFANFAYVEELNSLVV